MTHCESNIVSAQIHPANLPPAAQSLVELLSYRARTQPNERGYTFLKDGETEVAHLTYAALDRRARAIAQQLSNLAPGERVLLVFPSGLDFIATFMGCLYAGVIAVPVYPPSGPTDWPRFEKIAIDAGVCGIYTTRAQLAAFQTLFDADNPHLLQRLQCFTLDMADEACADLWRDSGTTSSSIAFLQYTSGSTGSPKGVMVSHGNVLHNLRMIQERFEIAAQGVIVGWLPLYHDMGLIGNVLEPLYLGIPAVLMSPVAFLVRPVRWLQAISRYGIATSGAPNFAYELCVRRVTDAQRSELDLSRWQIAFNGSEAVRADTLRRFADRFAVCGFRSSAFVCCYGMAEATLLVSAASELPGPQVQTIDAEHLQQQRVAPATDGAKSANVVSCGRTPGDLDIAVVDPQTGIPVAAGRIGEIWVHGPSVAQGYWNDQVRTQATFHARLVGDDERSFLRTGDLGFVEGGEVFITGRLKELIILRGRKYYPQDIEVAAQASHPALKADGTAAFSVVVDGEERLVVVQEIVRGAIAELHMHEAVDAIRFGVMTHFGLQLHDVVLLKQGRIAKTSSGKIRRHACRAAYLESTLEALSFTVKAAPGAANPTNATRDAIA